MGAAGRRPRAHLGGVDDTPDGRAPPAHDWRLLPAAGAVWAATWVVTGEHPAGVAVVLGAAALLGGLAGWRRSWLVGAVALLLVGAAVVGVLRVHAVRSGPVAAMAAEQAVVDVEVVTRTDLQQTSAAGGGELGWVRGELVRVHGRGLDVTTHQPVVVVVTGDRVGSWQHGVAGDRWRVLARLAPPDAGSDVAAVVRVRGDRVLVAPAGAGEQLVERVRAGLRSAVAARAEEQRALVPALVLGDTSLMGPELQDRFTATGLTHLTAVSGANLTLLLAFLLGLARAVGVRGWWLRLVGLGGVVVFVALCRTEPSVLRAAAMGLVALAALGWGGRGGRRGLRHLWVAVVVLLLLDPWLARSAGMALSVLASAGIVLWAGPWAERMRPWLPSWAAQAVTVPLSAQLATQPVVTAISQQVSLAGLAANALAGPFVGPATVTGFAAAGASLLWAPLAEFVALGSALSAQGIITVAHLGSALPGAVWAWPVDPWSLAVLATACVLLLRVVPVVLARWWATLLAAVLMVLSLLRPPVQPGWPPPDWFLVACDVGQGDGLLLRAGPRSAVVVDAGPEPAAMDACLTTLGVDDVPLLVLTHYHDDHVGGLAGVLAGRSVGTVLVSPLPLPAAQHREATGLLAAAGEAPVVARPGQRWVAGTVTWTTLAPVEPPVLPAVTEGEGESAGENDASVVGYAEVAGVRVLLTGDLEPPGQQALLDRYGTLPADVLKVPHHGSGSQEPELLTRTGARVAVVSAGADNDYGHPTPRTLDLLHGAGMRVLRTDEQGALALSASGEGLVVTTQR
jgi:competence protein ComEC